jgi:exopolysaccharide production protein ExoQ
MHLHLSPNIASWLTVAFIIFLFRRDIRERPDISGALWLPLIWLVIISSRGISLWLDIFGLPVSGGASVEEGSPLDAWFFLILIAAGIYVLNKRAVRLSEIVRSNQWLTIFLLYCLVSIIWSDFPFVAFKRWIKILGHPIMALIVLTEPNLEEALTRLLKRCAYVVVPVSILFIKYYPQLGRGFDLWTGEPYNTGITTNKNALGADCLILGFFFFWYLLQTWHAERKTWRRNELRLIAGFLIGIWWLFSEAHSATSLTSFFIAALVMVLVGIRSTTKNRIGTYLLTALVLFIAVELAFGISGRFSEALGRGSGMSGRTVLWKALLELHTNPIVGTGFESFWLGKMPQRLEGIFYYIPNQAHNGYLEIYLTLGSIGVFLLLGLFVATFWKTRIELFQNFAWGRFRLGFLVAIVVYNWTEAAFKSISATWFIFYLVAMDYPRTSRASAESSVEAARSEGDLEFAYVKGES